MKNGETVRRFEEAFAAYVHARFAIAMTNGTATIQVGLMSLGVKAGTRVSTSPLTMSATTIAILNAGGTPVFEDVNPDTWLIELKSRTACDFTVPISLYGLHQPFVSPHIVDDAAQTLRPHGGSAFTSYSLQRSKILQTGEGGVLATNDEALATEAREIASLGYKLGASQSRIDSNAIKSPTFNRHYRAASLNARMNDLTAAEGLRQLAQADHLLSQRILAANRYDCALDESGAEWLAPQHIPARWTHDYWTYAVACDTPERALALSQAVVRQGGEKPYPCWRLTFDEPAFRHLDPGPDACPVARSLQPRLLQFQTNDLSSAERNTAALRRAIEEVDS